MPSRQSAPFPGKPSGNANVILIREAIARHLRELRALHGTDQEEAAREALRFLAPRFQAGIVVFGLDQPDQPPPPDGDDLRWLMD